MLNILHTLDQILLCENEEKMKERDHSRWHGSDAGRCMRYRFYKRKGIPPTNPIDAKGLRRTQSGTIFHWWLNKRFIDGMEKFDLGKVIDFEGSVETDDWAGHPDLIIETPEKKQVLIEWKTAHLFAYKNIIKKGPSEHHVWQGMGYIYQLRQQEEYKDLDTLALVYLTLPLEDAKEFVYKFTPEWEKNVAGELEALNGYWERNELPPCTCAETWEAKYCGYKDPRGGRCCLQDLSNEEIEGLYK